MKRRMLVRTVWLSVWILAATLAHPANAQAGDPARAQPHLDAARALVGPEHRYAVQRYAQIAGLEARAGRTQNARELTHLIQGLILELPEYQRDPALYHLAQSYLDRGETDDAVRILRQAQTPTMMVRNIHLRVVHQTTAGSACSAASSSPASSSPRSCNAAMSTARCATPSPSTTRPTSPSSSSTSLWT